MLARLQQFTTIGLLLAALGWAMFWLNRSPALAFAGFLLVVGAYSLFLAMEFVALYWFSRGDPAPRPAPGELLSAWWGETLAAPSVFCWRQPFRSTAVPDFLPGNGLRGVVLVHGFVCNRGLWNPWLQALRARGHACVAVNLEPVFGSIDEYAKSIESAVQQVRADTGQLPVLVCHSMGGLAARAWMRSRAPGNEPAAHHVVTIGTPHHGTWLAQFSFVTNARQMRLDSPWLQQLAGDASNREKTREVGFTCWYSNCDNIVFPVSTATLPGADNRLVRGQAHVHLAFEPAILAHTLALLQT